MTHPHPHPQQMMRGQLPSNMANGQVYVMNTNTERETGKKAQLSNIEAAKTVADVIRTCLGPQAMLKMVLDPMGGIVVTSDGNSILREIEVIHPAARSMLELCRAQDEEVGDGTTSVIILAGEILAQMALFLERKMHPVTLISALKLALDDSISYLEEMALPIQTKDDSEILSVVQSSIGTKISDQWSPMICAMALKAVRCVMKEDSISTNTTTNNSEMKFLSSPEIDLKQYAKVERLPGGELEECSVLDGVMFNKDIVHSGMRRMIKNPRILLLDCSLEYKKGESQTSLEISKEGDWELALDMEERQIKEDCDHLISLKPDLIITEKGISDLAQHYLLKGGNISAIRRIRKTDNNRISRAIGATIINRVEDARIEDIGLGCGLFKIEKIGDEYFTFLTECPSPKACTILLRGPSKDILMEVERNLQDAMCVARNVMLQPKLSAGGGASEIGISVRLMELSQKMEGVERGPYRAVAQALEVIPRTLIQNAGGDSIRMLTELRAKHATKTGDSASHVTSSAFWGVDGVKVDSLRLMEKNNGVWDSFAVKTQTLKTAIESACMILRVDDIVAGLSSGKK